MGNGQKYLEMDENGLNEYDIDNDNYNDDEESNRMALQPF